MRLSPASVAFFTDDEPSRRPTRTSTPEFFRRLNGAKCDLSLDLAEARGQARLRDAVALIERKTASRP